MIWLPSTTAAELEGVTPRAMRQRDDVVTRRAKRGRNGKAIEVRLDSLTPAAQTRYYAEHPEVAPAPERDDRSRPAPRYAAADRNMRERADGRLLAVISYREALDSRASSETKRSCERRWLRRFRSEHPHLNVSIASVRRWSAALEAEGLDGLIDGNDGSGRRGRFSIDPEALAFFHARYLDRDDPPTIARAIRDTRDENKASGRGWSLPESDHPFYRYVQALPEAVKRARRDADNVNDLLPYRPREKDVPMRTWQMDHHIAKVFRACGGVLCGDGGCRRGHRVWITALIDVGSSAILSWEIALGTPNWRTILRVFRRAVELYGLPERMYVDNGKDFRKAFGKALRDAKLEALDGGYFLNLTRPLGIEVIYAIPYNAQAKKIERMFSTWVQQLCRGTEGYVGKLGQRSERNHELYLNPETLPTVTDFAVELESQIVRYNTSGSRGRGMRGQSPIRILADERRPRRDPDAVAFALVFHGRLTRKYGRNGVTIGPDQYLLPVEAAAAHLEVFGHYVDVLVDHDDRRRVLLLTGCDDHKRNDCGCPKRGKAIGYAELLGLASNDAAAPITQDILDRVGKMTKALRQRVNAGDLRAQRDLERFKRERIAIAQQIAGELLAENAEYFDRAAGHDGATVTLLPRYSQIAREIERGGSRPGSVPPGLTPERLALADSVDDETDEFLNEVLDRPHTSRSSEQWTPVLGEGIGDELERVRAIQELKRKRRERLCLEGGCTEPQEIGAYCDGHWSPEKGDVE